MITLTDHSPPPSGPEAHLQHHRPPRKVSSNQSTYFFAPASLSPSRLLRSPPALAPFSQLCPSKAYLPAAALISRFRAPTGSSRRRRLLDRPVGACAVPSAARPVEFNGIGPFAFLSGFLLISLFFCIGCPLLRSPFSFHFFSFPVDFADFPACPSRPSSPTFPPPSLETIRSMFMRFSSISFRCSRFIFSRFFLSLRFFLCFLVYFIFYLFVFFCTFSTVC